jgi:transcriptional regulator GlxA family with amidase domain
MRTTDTTDPARASNGSGSRDGSFCSSFVIAATSADAYDRRMTSTPPARSRGRTRRILFFTFDGGQSLDVTGPFEAFAMARRELAAQDPEAAPPYELQIAAARRGPVRMNSGLQVVADRHYGEITRGVDTLIVAGGDVTAMMSDRRVHGWLRRMARRVRRLASVCTGSLILAEAGLLDGRRATTHWRAVEQMRQNYPKVSLEPDAIYVRDGHVYTSAGVTAGIDLALAMVEEDLGHAIAVAVARRLVVFLKRPGGQSQFSSHLAAQVPAPGALKGLPEWILGHLTNDLSVEGLAGRVAMSPRNFARVFRRETGITPAKFVERARVDEARRRLEDGGLSLDEVAARCGFASGEHMRRTFLRHLRVVPGEYRKRFRLVGTAAS